MFEKQKNQSAEVIVPSERLPEEGASVLAVFGKKLVEAKVFSYSPDKTKVTFINEAGDTKETSVQAVSPEVQALMEADRPTRMARERGDIALDSVGVIEPAPELAEVKGGNYDDLLDPDYDNFSVEKAAVRPVETEDERNLRELRTHHQKVAKDAEIQTGADFYRAGHK